MPPSDRLSPCLAFRELILGRGWASRVSPSEGFACGWYG